MVIHWEAASSALDRIMGTFHVRNAKGRMAVIAEIKFGQVTVKVNFAAMLVNALNATLEHAPDVLNCVGVNVAANVLILGMNDCGMARKLFSGLGIDRAFVGVQD